jgi:hypothetical protein
MESEVVFTVEDNRLRRVIRKTDPADNSELIYPPSLLQPISAREFVVVTKDESEGSQVDFIEGDYGAIRFLRMDGRLYDRLTEDAPR